MSACHRFTMIFAALLTGFPVQAQETADEIISVQGGSGDLVLPAFGEAVGYEQSQTIPDAFCNVEGTRGIPEEAPTTRPQCCSTATDSAPGTSVTGGFRDSPAAPKSSVPQPETPVYLAVFDDAAHFSAGENRSCSTIAVTTPYVIYEGMIVRIRENGCYEVRAMVDGPRIPAILRLQLKFTVDGNPATVTLPPIRLMPEERSVTSLTHATQTWFVRRTGYSHRLSHLLAHFDSLTVRRNGTAEIGQVPAL